MYDDYDEVPFTNVELCVLPGRPPDVMPAQRFDLSVNSRSHWKAVVDNVSSVKRHCQFPPIRPGTFIRLPGPKSRTSCNGATVKAATDDHASAISAGAASALFASGRPRQLQKVCFCESGNCSYHSRVGGLSCVPVYATVLWTKLEGRYGLSA